MAARGEYDTAALFSTDSDLRPALEAVVALREPIEEGAGQNVRRHERR